MKMTSTEVKERALETGTDRLGLWALVWDEDRNEQMIVRPYVIGAAIVWKAS